MSAGLKNLEIISRDGFYEDLGAKTETLVNGILAAAKETGLSIPLIVRLEGTNVAKGRELIANSDLDVITAESLNDAAQKAVAAVSA